MKIHRFIDNFDLSKNEIEIDGEIARQMHNVLKLEPGEKVELCNGKGSSAFAQILKIDKESVQLKIENPISSSHLEGQNEIKKVNLYCAVLKKENFELVVQKATECGVTKIIPIISARTVKTGLRMERLEKIAKEASEQSGRNDIPEISEPISFEESLKIAQGSKIIFDAEGELLLKAPCERDGASTRNFSAEKYPCAFNNNSPEANIFIGPEGGWTKEEIKKARNAGFQIFSLGPLTLRGETAAIIATYLASNLI